MAYPQGLPVQTIWDEIAYFLESTKDLLSLALTCRTFKDLIIPDHLEYRYIHCDLRRGDVWKFLASRPRLGKGIRSLKMLNEPGDTGRVLLPQALTEVSLNRMLTTENLALFRSALSHMTFLKEFTWKHTHGGNPPAKHFIDASRVLTNTTHCLEALCVDFGLLMLLGNRSLFDTLSIWTLTGLKKVKISHPGTTAIHMALDRCPDLEDLHLTDHQSNTTSVYYVMQRGNWKKLRRVHFYLSNPTSLPSPDMNPPAIVASFFDRHDTLESIHFEVYGGSFPSQPASRLPKLRSVGSQIHGPGTTLPTYLSSDVMSRLVHWHCPIEKFDIDTFPQMDDLESACFTIYDFYSPAFVPFLSKAPNLKKICVGEAVDVIKPVSNKTQSLLAKKTQRSLISKVLHEALIDISLQSATHLTHLFCDYALDEGNDANFQENLNSSLKILSDLQSLTYFRIISDGGSMLVMKLERDEEGVYSGYQPIDLKEAGGDPHYWGDFISEF